MAVEFPALAQLLVGVVPHGVEHPIAARPAGSSNTSDFSTRLLRRSMHVGRFEVRRRAITASAASRVQPPANTASRRNAARSRSSSRSKLQSISARRVRCRGSTVRSRVVSEPETLVEPRRDDLDGQRARAGCGQFERQRNAVKADDRFRRPRPGNLVGPTGRRGSRRAARSRNSRTEACCCQLLRASRSSGRGHGERLAGGRRPRRRSAAGHATTPGSSGSGSPAAAASPGSPTAAHDVLAVVDDQQQSGGRARSAPALSCTPRRLPP